MEALLQQNLWLAEVLAGFLGLSFKQVIMWLIGGGLILAAVKKDFQLWLVLPFGVGVILANIPYSGAASLIPGEEGFLRVLYQLGLANELLPVALLMLIGAGCDFGPLLRRPALLLVAVFCQLGLFAVVWGARVLDFSFPHAASIGATAAADAAAVMYVASRYAEAWFGALVFTAFVLAALVPVIQPPVVRALTTAAERGIEMDDCAERPVGKKGKLVFALAVLLVAGLLAPKTASLSGALIFGNILRESGCLAKAPWKAGRLSVAIYALAGLTVGGTMDAERMLSIEAAFIVALGIAGFIINTVCGVVAVKLLNVLAGRKINPLLGACGVAAFPVPGRPAGLAAGENVGRYALGVNAAGQIAAILSAGLILAIIPTLVK